MSDPDDMLDTEELEYSPDISSTNSVFWRNTRAEIFHGSFY